MDDENNYSLQLFIFESLSLFDHTFGKICTVWLLYICREICSNYFIRYIAVSKFSKIFPFCFTISLFLFLQIVMTPSRY